MFAPPRPRRATLVTLLFLIVAALAPAPPARAQSDPPSLDAATRARVSRAADDPVLPEWQRGVMRELAGARATSLGDGAWNPMPAFGTPEQRYDAGTIYDPVRQRLIVFGGYDRGDRNDTWALSLTGTPTWTRLETFGAPPGERHGARAVYDSKRDRMIVFGGASAQGQFLNDAWALTLSEPHLWQPIAASGTPPVERFLCGQCYDSKRDRLVVFGGYSSLGARNDLWFLSLGATPTWTKSSLVSGLPPVRYDQCTLYDAGRDRLVVFGGYTTAGTLNDVWVLPFTAPSAWAQLTPTGTAPSVRGMAAAAFDAARDRMIVRGGNQGSTYSDDLWALSFAGTPSWTNLTPASGATPGGRGGESIAVDPVGDRLVTFGGVGAAGIQGDTWELPFAGTPEWHPLVGATPAPYPRSLHSTILDPSRDQLIVYGGNWASDHGDTWSLSLSSHAWTPLLAGGPAPGERSRHSAVYDPVRDRMIVFGGLSNNISRNDVQVLSLSPAPVWSPLTPVGTPPSARYQHTAIYDAVHDRMIVFGGLDFSGPRNDVWALSLSGSPTWSLLTPTGTPPTPRYETSAIADPARDRMLVFSGAASGPTSDVWELTLGATPAWTALAPSGDLPPALEGHVAVLDPDRDRMLVFGGYSTSAYMDRTWALSLTGSPTWTELHPPGNRPSGRKGHTAVYDPSRELVWAYGGFDGGVLNDVWTFTPLAPVGVEPPYVPSGEALRPVLPNPSTDAARVRFSLARDAHVRIDVLDVSGRRVRTLLDRPHIAGEDAVTWDGADEAGHSCGAGVYFVRLEAPGVHATRRIVRLK